MEKYFTNVMDESPMFYTEVRYGKEEEEEEDCVERSFPYP